jgi:hypothetical protein
MKYLTPQSRLYIFLSRFLFCFVLVKFITTTVNAFFDLETSVKILKFKLTWNDFGHGGNCSV